MAWHVRESLAALAGLRNRLRHLSPARLAVTAFIGVIVVVALLLMAPWATTSRQPASPIDALFTATSAVCVTGLTTVPTALYWSTYGQVVILVAVKIGGLGVMTIGAMLSLLISRRLGLTQRLLAQSETRSGGLGEVGQLLRSVAIASTSIELVTAAVLATRLAALGDSAGRAVWHGLFYGVSAFNNAGFVPTVEGLEPLRGEWLILLPIALGVFIGSLGFPVILNCAQFWRHPSRWRMHTKMTITTSACLLVVAVVMIGVLEWFNPATLGAMAPPDRLLNTVFAGAMPRSGGFSTVDIAALKPSTLLTLDALMFIGGGSASTAGGIKVTTLAVMLLAIRAEGRGDRDMEAFGRRVDPDVLRVCVTVAVASLALVFAGILALLPMTQAPTDHVVFETVSAFATCGLSTGLSAALPAGGKLVLAALMLAGRLGTMTLAAALALSNRRSLIRLPEERPIVG
jgi:Trk-type K+ transport system membrane component